MINEVYGRGTFYNIRGLGFILIFLFLFNIIFYFTGVFTAGLIFHTGIPVVRDLLTKPDGSALAINITRYVSMVNLVGYMFLPVLMFTLINRSTLAEEGKLKQKLQAPVLFLCVLVAALAVPFAESLNHYMQMLPLPRRLEWWANRYEHAREATVNTLLDMHEWPELLGCLFLVALLPAFFEELMFRGVVLNIFSHMTRRKWTPVILQAFLFGALHFSFYQFPAIFFMGILFGYIAQKTQTIWYGVWLHFLFNGVTVVLSYIQHIQFDRTGVNHNYSGMLLHPLLAVAALTGIIVLIRLIHNVSLKKEIHG